MIIAVGHTPEKFDRLIAMLDGRTVIKVWNGDERRDDAINVPNDFQGRDVAMYFEGTRWCMDEKLIFVNDDVEHLDERFFDNYEEDVVGVPNLSSWVDHHLLSGHNLEHAQLQGRAVRFIRTSAFHMTRDLFNRTYGLARGNAQKFEKHTLTLAGSYKLLPPEYAYDSNIAKYVGR